MTKAKKEIILFSEQEIFRKIYTVRGQRVMFDRDLAKIYGVETKQLNRQVNRNLDSFPADFMFRLNFKEYSDLRCQIGTSNRGGLR